MKKVDVIIPAYCPDQKLSLIVDRLNQQTHKPNMIYIVNTKCPQAERRTGEIFSGIGREHDNVKFLEVEEREFDHGGTRDMAVRISKADYVLMMTMDAVPKNRKLIRQLLNAFGEGVAVVYGRQEADKNCRIIERYTRTFNYPDEPSSAIEKAATTNNGIKSIFCSDVCAMYDRKIYDEVGGFPGKTIFNEDEIFAAKALRAGFDVLYEPSAIVIHSHNYTGVQYFKRYFDLGVSQADYAYIFREYHAEDEGVRLVFNTMEYLIHRGQYPEIPRLFWQSGMKYLGMKLGKNYKKLPQSVIDRCTANPGYWKR